MYLDTFKDIWERGCSSQQVRSQRNLDTFKDIWELLPVPPSVNHMYVFRYLQGYMGTSVQGKRRHSQVQFRYLQGYMGTFTSSAFSESYVRI